MDSNETINIRKTINGDNIYKSTLHKEIQKADCDNSSCTVAVGLCTDPSPSTLLGRTLSASAVDYKTVWRNKKSTFIESLPIQLAGSKRKHSSQDYPNMTTTTSSLQLPNFINLPPNSVNNNQVLKPVPTNNTSNSNQNSEFITPNQPKKPSNSRPNSPRPILPRGRVASIRRESDCSGENEAAHEKLIKSAQQVSSGFEDFCLDDKLFEERKRAKSLTEPISIFTNAFLIQNASPSPTRGNVDIQKQCYSPSTQQVVRSNISYSPSPSPTPGSPYNRMRSLSPSAVKQITKRRYTASAGNCCNENGSGLESDGESSASSHSQHGPPPHKRQCTTTTASRSTANASPLIRDSQQIP